MYLHGRDLGVGRWQLLVHDWSKFLPSEFHAYNDVFYNMKDSDPEFLRELYLENMDRAWNHHQKRNKHHWQYWVLIEDSGIVKPLPMPEHYVREMIADWAGAGEAIYGRVEVVDWYTKNHDKINLHKDTRVLVEELLDDYFGYPRSI